MLLLKSLKHLPNRLYHSETLDYKTRILAAGGSISTTSLDYAEKFVQDCKNGFVWNKLEEIGLFLGDQLAAALIKLKYRNNSFLINNNFTSGNYAERGANGGLLGDGLTKYLDTAYNAQDLPDNGHLSFYLREDVGAAGTRGLAGAFSLTDHFILGSLQPDTNVVARYGALYTAQAARSFTKGFYLLSRTGADLALRLNGATIAQDTSSFVMAKPNGLISLWGWNFTGGPTMQSYLPARGSFYSIGQALTEAESAVLYQAVQTLQRNLNREVLP